MKLCGKRNIYDYLRGCVFVDSFKYFEREIRKVDLKISLFPKRREELLRQKARLERMRDTLLSMSKSGEMIEYR